MERGQGCEEIYTIVEKKQLTAVYQPICWLKTMQPYAFESLARGPARGRYAQPINLFQDAIALGIAHEIDLLAVEMALQGASHRRESTFFINILPSTLLNGKSVERLLQLLDASPVKKEQIVFELTERTTVNDFTHLRRVVNRLRQERLRVAIDDLGQGYSSLAAIIELEPEFVKLDRSLISGIVRSPMKQRIVKMLVDISQEEIQLIAEGIEQKEDLVYLRNAGIRFGQGFLLGRPGKLPPESRHQT